MPFNLSQIFGGWRRRGASRKTDGSPHSSRSRLTLPRQTSGGSDGPFARVPNEARPSKTIAKPQTKSHSALAGKLLVAPHISEKATMLGDGRYVFKVADNADKNSLKRAIESRYGVGVESVNIIAQRDKNRRRGQILGVKPGFKKAVVTLKAEDKIAEF